MRSTGFDPDTMIDDSSKQVHSIEYTESKSIGSSIDVPRKRTLFDASLYWATNYQTVKRVKNFDIQPLKESLLDFLDRKGESTAFKE